MYGTENRESLDAEAAMYERAVGAAILEYVRCCEPQFMAQKLNDEALQLVKEIQLILDDGSLDDSECFQKIEAITALFHRHGIITSRHDYG